jgi:hypothetical protein
MIETRTWRASPVPVTDSRASQTDSSASAARTWRTRLWAVLRAQALLRGTGGGPGDVAFIEDDRHRLARRGN